MTGSDHCTGLGFDRQHERGAIFELSHCDRYIAASGAVADRLKAQGITDWIPDARPTSEIVGGRGYPEAREAHQHPRRAPSGRRRVMYLPSVFRGLAQSSPPSLPDVLQLDWQLHVAETLRGFPVEARVRPHPEGKLPIDRHPIIEYLPVEWRSFEEAMHDVDLLLFDWPRSSTFWVALCTDKPIVLLENAESFRDTCFAEDIRQAISERCVFLSAQVTSANTRRTNVEELREAILGAPDHVDPGPFLAWMGTP